MSDAPRLDEAALREPLRRALASRSARRLEVGGRTAAAVLVPLFERDGDDLHCVVPVSITTAALGGEISVPTLKGPAAIDIPDGTQSGKQFRLRGKGFSILRSNQRGDMFIQVAVETPQHLTRRQRELLEAFEVESHDHANGSPESEGFFAKVREFFENGGR